MEFNPFPQYWNPPPLCHPDVNALNTAHQMLLSNNFRYPGRIPSAEIIVLKNTMPELGTRAGFKRVHILIQSGRAMTRLNDSTEILATAAILIRRSKAPLQKC